jgi:hypothetical protein
MLSLQRGKKGLRFRISPSLYNVLTHFHFLALKYIHTKSAPNYATQLPDISDESSREATVGKLELSELCKELFNCFW